jgi:predicted DsbA family dithiol-disulfide isomerase
LAATFGVSSFPLYNEDIHQKGSPPWEGTTSAFDRMRRTPNTLDAHRLLWLAGRLGGQDGVAELLFKGYFTQGLDLNDRPTLVTLATAGGIPTAEA